MADTEETQVSLKVLIDREKKKVVFAEAGSDFVDILFSFLTMPMATIVRLLAKHSDPSHHKVNIGSFNNLYGSVANLDPLYFGKKELQDMLLNPRNSAEAQCRKLKINIDDMKPIQYFICDALCFNRYFGVNAYLSTRNTVKCNHCGSFLKKEIKFHAEESDGEGVFVTRTSSFVITDDLRVIPDNPTSTLGILKRNGIKDFAALEENTLVLGSKEILHLLEFSFLSKTPLSDLFFGKKRISSRVPTIHYPVSTECNDGAKKMTIKIYVQKSTNKILLAHSSDEFIDFLFSLLTIPLGKVISLLTKDHESTLSIENMYESVLELNDGECLRSQIKDKLLYPKLPQDFLFSNHIFSLEGEKVQQIFEEKKIVSGGNKYSLPFDFTYKESIDQSPNVEGSLMRGTTKFMVTDDLVVSPLSSISCFTYLHKQKVPPSDIEEQVIDIGMKEAQHLLRASLTSTSVLSNGLRFFILNSPKHETSAKKPKTEGF